jgi:signal transduction histidine kinase
VQQAIVNHERGLERVLESLAPEQQAPAAVSLRDLMTELVRFMTNDTARNHVRVRQDFSDDLTICTVPARLRLIALGLLIESIDAMPTGGELRIAGRTTEGRVQLEIIDSRAQPRPTSFVHEAIERIVTHLSGRIQQQQSPAGGCEVRVELPAA